MTLEIYYKAFKTMAYVPNSEGIGVNSKIRLDMSTLHTPEGIVVMEMYNGNFLLLNRANTITDGEITDEVKHINNNIIYNMPPNMSIIGELVDEGIRVVCFLVNDICLSWDATNALAISYGLTTSKVLYRGLYDEEILKTTMANESINGYFIRSAGGFFIDELDMFHLKYLKKNNVKC